MAEAVILGALRTPIGRFRGGLSRVRPDDLAALTLRALLKRVPPAAGAVGEVILGATNQAGEDCRNVARMASLLAGLPYEVPGVTVNRLCGSGLEAVIQAARLVRTEEVDVVVAGGVESMSRAPYAMAKAEEAFPRSPPAVHDTTLGWRFPNPAHADRFELVSLGETAERVAVRFAVSRAAQDTWALQSHRKASSAWADGSFAEEVVEVRRAPAHRKEPPVQVLRDESIRPDTSEAKLAALPPAFRAEGTVTAGNSSPLNDGAAGLLIASGRWAKDNGCRPIARVVASGVAGVDPNLMGIGPVPACRLALERAGLTAADIELAEVNEAFAAQTVACVRELGLPPSRVNVNGGAIALGHPVGCSGARIVVTLAHALQHRQARYGLATLCIGVGQGLAVILERVP